jgi:glycosyltransferase involved in cell wall biosynthesis
MSINFKKSESFDMTVGVPAYGRPNELKDLLDSILSQSVFPMEVLICEDMSPERMQLMQICRDYQDRFNSVGVALRFHANESNLGYDGNVRQLFALASCSWVMLLGNDDIVLPSGVALYMEYIKKHPNCLMISRAFKRFEGNPDNFVGESCLFNSDTFITKSEYSSAYIFRASGFVGGLVFDRVWADSKKTDKYDGTLYYQYYLACLAYIEKGIGYLSTSPIGGRAANPPLFGNAKAEESVHKPGGYAPKARAKMWSSILKISNELGLANSIDVLSDVKKELGRRQSFHVFEGYAGKSKLINDEMRMELEKLDLYNSIHPRIFYFVNILLGRFSVYFYVFVRRVFQ